MKIENYQCITKVSGIKQKTTGINERTMERKCKEVFTSLQRPFQSADGMEDISNRIIYLSRINGTPEILFMEDVTCQE